MEKYIFNTKRLRVRQFIANDKDHFIELLSDPEIINPVPQRKFSAEEISQQFKDFSSYANNVLKEKRTVWAITKINQSEVIGLCALLTNDEDDRELAYRFRTKYWGNGYGTEIAQGLIDYSFNDLKLDKITADVNVENIGSVKILEKFLVPVREFYNESDQCTDRRYILKNTKGNNNKQS